MAASPSISSPFKFLDTVGPQHEKALKQAFYNTAAIVFVLLSLAVSVSAYYVLEIFLRPLIWAALCGTFIFPFKKASTKITRDWLNYLKENNTSVLVGFVILPLNGVNRSADLLGSIIKTNYKLMISIFVLVPLCYYLVVFHPFYQIVSGLKVTTDILVKLLEFFNYPLAVWTIFIGYLILLLLYKKPFSSNSSSSNDTILKCISVGVWYMMLFYIGSLAGPGKGPVSIFLVILILVGIVGKQKSIKRNASTATIQTKVTQLKKENNIKKFVDGLLHLFGIQKGVSNSSDELSRTNSSVDLVDDQSSSVESIVEADLESSDIIKNPKLDPSTDLPPEDVMEFPKSNPNVEALKSNQRTPIFPKKPAFSQKGSIKPKLKRDNKRKRIGSSDRYFIALFWLFTISRVWMNIWILEIVPLLFIIYLLKFLFVKLSLSEVIVDKSEIFIERMYNTYLDMYDIMFPGPVGGLLYMLRSANKWFISMLDRNLDQFMSVFIIFCLGIMSLLGTAFFAVQVHHESSYLVTVATDVVNKTIVMNQDYLRWMNLNDSDVRKTFDSTVHSAYMIGRKKMAGFVSSSLTSKDSNTSLMEQQITQFLDQLYNSWTGKEDNLKLKSRIDAKDLGNKTNETFLRQQWSKLNHFIYGSDLATNLFGIMKENMHTFQSVLNSIWTILRGNMNLMISIITHIISIIFLSGSYILNILISMIIFNTTLFYLLSASSENYKIVDWLSGLSMGTRFGESINTAIQDVFGASLKMALFYGIYTWMTHSVFGANLIFIPAVFAATLGVVPFIGTYWAAVPATLEIWLIHNDGLLAVLLLALHMLPTYVVDTAIYNEIGGGGHPYLTGLAVAGGVYCIGLEGAFVGPIVLCCLIAAFDVYNSIMNDNSDEKMQFPSVASRFRRAMSESR